jgi:hypothetical protein
MRFPRSLVFSLTMSMCVAPCIAPCVAQSPREFTPAPLPNPFIVQPLPGSQIPAMDFHALTPPSTSKGPRIFRLPSRQIRNINPFAVHPHSDDLYAVVTPLALGGLPPGTNLASRDGPCYAIRSYYFSRVAPNSDATKLSGSSTCEPAAQVRLKGAVVR